MKAGAFAVPEFDVSKPGDELRGSSTALHFAAIPANASACEGSAMHSSVGLRSRSKITGRTLWLWAVIGATLAFMLA
jgi:hypothetical protein